jgi:hypothetical protein
MAARFTSEDVSECAGASLTAHPQRLGKIGDTDPEQTFYHGLQTILSLRESLLRGALTCTQ